MEEWVSATESEYLVAELSSFFGQEAERLLGWLSSFGADPAGGVTRLLYSEAWTAAQLALAERMAQAGLTVVFDRVGNLYGRLIGEDSDAPSIVTGSHIDTVRNGGKYDGVYGIAAALLAVEQLIKRHGKPRRTIEIVSLAEEEGSRFPMTYWGSGSITGFHNEDSIEGLTDADGVTFREAMEAAGFGKSEQPASPRSDIAAFIELHIEQGIVLEREKLSIGIVSAIVGQKRFAIEVTGQANHAGTTPMLMRRDALAAAADMVRSIREAAVRCGAPLVATVGRLELEPNTPNVIPGKTRFTVDVRHDNEEKLQVFCREMLGELEAIAGVNGVELTFSRWMDAKPVPMDGLLSTWTEEVCRRHGLSYQHMVSGAGHDAQMFQRICPTAMVFVPSRDGISHSPSEYTSSQDMGTGIFVLAQLLYLLGYAEAYKGVV
ncbi:allantoate deiminase [Paenibacillus sp. UNC451MF]|uniref:allantoate deiminase n=1 Tax=Paenibacillus sp. UNC451MF TaxID=1449063 RepID=UPI0009E0B2C9|nr:allantoate deiminase [Paenibacillus sp. UNC451MF]